MVEAAHAAHGPQGAWKFIEEVFCRSYLKGYLETHPPAWNQYIDAVTEQRDRLAANSGWRRA